MLHYKSWKSSAQSDRTIIFLRIIFFALASSFISCKGILTSSNEDLIAQTLAENIDSAKVSLNQLLLNNNDSFLSSSELKDYYQDNGDFIWVNSPESLEKSDTLIKYIGKSSEEIGFNKKVFLVDSILSDISRLNQQITDSSSVVYETMARIEFNISRAYLKYISGQYYGFLNPLRLFNKLDKDNNGAYRPLFDISIQLPEKEFATNALSKANSDDVLEYIMSLEPQDPIYLALKKELQKDSIKEHRQKLVLNMERCRWKIKDNPLNEKKYVFVNIPSQNLWAIQPDSVLSMKICCGAFHTKTPLLISKINLVQFNPEWGIPMSIIKKEVSEHAGDSAYFARHRYSIIQNDGDTINPAEITSAELRSGNYRISQKSGPGNSLGRIIFRFPNKFDVYLHDTNNPGAFQNERRTISHGCVRVQKPFQLTMFVLPDLDEWTIDKIRLSVDIKPETDKGKNYLQNFRHKNGAKPLRLINSLRTNPETPVYIAYYTAFPNPSTHDIEFWPDRYEYDKQMWQALKPFLP